MIDILRAIRTRRSIRKFMDDAPVEWSKIGAILDAGRLAPNAGNLQCWAFLVIQDKNRREELAEAALKQMWMAKAPIFIVICGHTDKIKQFYGERGEKLYIIQDCACAAENMALAAHAQGLGTCLVGAFAEETVSRILKLPDHIRPMLILPIGYPDEKPEAPIKYTLENVTHFEQWGGISRITNINDVLWSYRWGEKAVKNAEALANEIDKEIKKKKLIEKLKAKGQQIKKMLEEQARKKREKG